MKKTLAKSKLNKIRKYFESEKVRIRALISRNSNEELDIDGDDVDVVQGVTISNVVAKLSGRDIKRLEKIDAAIKKMDDGSFGVCESCDEAIGEKRLMAMPESIICIACAEEEEREAKLYG